MSITTSKGDFMNTMDREALYKKRKRQVIRFLQKHKRRPNRNDNKERQLWRFMVYYTCPRYNTFDSNFKDLVDKLCPSIKMPEERKKATLEFVMKYKRPPSVISKNQWELKMAGYYRQWRSPASKHYDPIFRCLTDQLTAGSGRAPNSRELPRVTDAKHKIIEFIKENERNPGRSKQASKKELSLYKKHKRYTNPSSSSYDPEFKEVVRNLRLK